MKVGDALQSRLMIGARDQCHILHLGNVPHTIAIGCPVAFVLEPGSRAVGVCTREPILAAGLADSRGSCCKPGVT